MGSRCGLREPKKKDQVTKSPNPKGAEAKGSERDENVLG